MQSQKLAELLEFFNERLGYKENCSCVISRYEKLKINGSIVLKIDTEGAEYDYFEKVDLEKLAKFTDGIILEIHWINKEDLKKRRIHIMEKLKEHYVLFHIHGNNWSGIFDLECHIFSDVLELSFAHKRLVKACEDDKTSYPIQGLDFSNHPFRQDYAFNFFN